MTSGKLIVNCHRLMAKQDMAKQEHMAKQDMAKQNNSNICFPIYLWQNKTWQNKTWQNHNEKAK